MKEDKSYTIRKLSLKVLTNLKNFNEIERDCWMIVHEHCNGSKPVEYDIRGVDESLYLAFLKSVKAQIEE